MGRLQTLLVQETPRLRRFAYSLTGSKADADDLVQNLVVRLLKAGLPDDVPPVPWMLRICKNLWIDEVRSREVRTRATTVEQLNMNHATADNETELHIDTEKVLNAMEQLPDNQRIAISLVAVESLSYADAAEVMGVPVGTIMSRVARARAKLMQEFDGPIGVGA